MSEKLKAFTFDTEGDGSSDITILIYAETRGKAKSIALKTEWLTYSDIEFTDLKMNRRPEADRFAQKPGEHEFNTEDYELFRNILDLHECEKDQCQQCSLTDYNREEYRVCWGCDTCAECSEATSFCKTCFLCSKCGHNTPGTEKFADWQPACEPQGPAGRGE